MKIQRKREGPAYNETIEEELEQIVRSKSGPAAAQSLGRHNTTSNDNSGSKGTLSKAADWSSPSRK